MFILSTKMRHFIMGAFNKDKQYTIPQNAIKGQTYECPECKEELVLKKGNIRVHHFSHKKDTSCKYLDKPSESYQHLGAKHLIRYKLQNTPIQINRQCSMCQNTITFNIPQCDNTVYSVELEHRFMLLCNRGCKIIVKNNEGGDLRIADIAILNKQGISHIIEILYTHKTDKNNRIDPWFEIDARKVLSSDINNNVFDCVREDICENCINSRYESLSTKVKSVLSWKFEDLEFYIRYKLGQRVFRDGDWHGEEHERLSYHCDDEHNDNIISIFNDILPKIDNTKKRMSRAWKGGIEVYLINKDNGEEKDIIYEYSMEGTVDDIKSLVRGKRCGRF
jgi:hypothetical protein